MLKNDEKVLSFLGTRAAPIKTVEITKATKLPYQSVLRSLKRLKELGVIRSVFGPGNSRLYSLASHVPVSATEPELMASRPVDLWAALKVFQVHKLPKFIELGTYKAYARAVSGVFKHAVEVGYGAAPDQRELNHYRKDLEYYREQIIAHLRGIESVLNTKELWDDRTNPEFLMTMNGFDLQEVSDKVTIAQEANK